MRRHSGFVSAGIDPYSPVMKVMPVEEHARKRSEQAMRNREPITPIPFRLERAKHRAARAKNIHWMRGARQKLECCTERRG